ncbi:uncharacterized protein PAC_14755 [Phialocephala subalpina]|uniref:Uncharacterized protein n=1 Tax=Phialocephala subalpina TaxID=576137 RepID=A0A1L7XIS2_9HELO|nr:uncharacterized protein PAC_14755 [Phialocephala subalpina]
MLEATQGNVWKLHQAGALCLLGAEIEYDQGDAKHPAAQAMMMYEEIGATQGRNDTLDGLVSIVAKVLEYGKVRSGARIETKKRTDDSQSDSRADGENDQGADSEEAWEDIGEVENGEGENGKGEKGGCIA